MVAKHARDRVSSVLMCSCASYRFFVTKNKVVETDLQLVKTVKLRKNTVRRAT